MKNSLFILSFLSYTCGIFTFLACSNDHDDFYINKLTDDNEYIYFSKEMSTEVKMEKIKKAEKRFLDNIDIIDGKISLSHTCAEELYMEEEYYEAMKFLLENIENPYDIIIPKTRSTTLSSSEAETEDLIFSKECVGNMILKELSSDFEKKCFTNYWYEKGDMILTEEEWSDIKQYAEQNYTPGDTCTNKVTKEIYFYDNPKYKYALGRSRVTFIVNNAIGFYDEYNFDSKKWGERPVLAEIITRIIGTLGYIYNGKDFLITYGEE